MGKRKGTKQLEAELALSKARDKFNEARKAHRALKDRGWK